MKTTIKYTSNDGVEFVSEQACLKHEYVACLIQGALAPLGERPNLSGEKFHQHLIEDVRKASSAVLMIVQNEYPHESIREYTIDNCSADNSSVWLTWLVRYCDEVKIGKSLHRLRCINQHTGREYEQPYHAIESARGGAQ